MRSLAASRRRARVRRPRNSRPSSPRRTAPRPGPLLAEPVSNVPSPCRSDTPIYANMIAYSRSAATHSESRLETTRAWLRFAARPSDAASLSSRDWLGVKALEDHPRLISEDQYQSIVLRRCFSGRAGSDRAGSDRAGFDRAGFDRAGFNRAGFNRPYGGYSEQQSCPQTHFRLKQLNSHWKSELR